VKRLLVVAFAVPPTPGPSPARSWHLARHLPAFGWEVVVLTPRHPRRLLAVEKTREHRNYPIPLRRVIDPAGSPFWLQETEYRDLIPSWRRPIRRTDDGPALPGLYGKEFLDENEAALQEPLSPRGGLQGAIAAFRFNPDSRAGWIRPALDGANAVCEAMKPDAVYSVSPPVSAHAIAARIAKRMRIPWIAGLRDPWRGNPIRLFDQWNRMRILGTARSTPLPPSFDPTDLAGRARIPSTGSSDSAARIPVLVHAGSTAVRGRDPVPLLDGVRRVIDAGAPRRLELRLRLLGARDPRLGREIGQRSLGRVITVEPTVPWSVSMETQADADALLLLLGPDERDRVPDRLLEAMSAGRSVFALGPPDTRTERLLREAGLGSYHMESSSLADGIGRWLREGAVSPLSLDNDAIAPYRAENVAARLAGLLEEGIRSGS
jgi:hypothetical protein